ncbi:MAG: hypothetical protein ACR2JY_07455 [Chloroflexota bacterium]
MRSYTTVTRERGVTTIPIDLRETAAVTPETTLTWVELEPQLWLVGPATRHPEQSAPLIATALRSGETPFPKLMRRLIADHAQQPTENSVRQRRPYRSFLAPVLTEEQMIARGTPSPPVSRRRRGRL